MELEPNQDVKVDTLDHCLTTSLMDLRYLGMGPNQSMLDTELSEDREQAIQTFHTTLEDNGEEYTADVKAALAWLLNLNDSRFRTVVQRLNVPYPRFDPVDLRRFLELVWSRTWPAENWHIPDFDEGKFTVSYREAL